MKCTIFIGLVINLVFLANRATAQSSIMTEISYPLLEKLTQIAKENYPRLKTIDKQISIAEINVRKSKASWLDVLNIAYMRNENLGASDKPNVYMINGLQYGINVNVGSLMQKSAQMKNARHELEIAWLEKEEYNQMLASKVKERYFTYIQQLTLLKLRMKATQDAESVLHLIKARFEKGEETFENYNEALAALSNQNQQKISAETAMLIAKSNLEELIGIKLEEVDYWKMNLDKAAQVK